MTESAPRRAALRPEMANEIRILNGVANERTTEMDREWERAWFCGASADINEWGGDCNILKP